MRRPSLLQHTALTLYMKILNVYRACANPQDFWEQHQVTEHISHDVAGNMTFQSSLMKHRNTMLVVLVATLPALHQMS